MEQIFCDETGFTGPDLLNPDQKYFGYASVHMEEQEASELVGRIRAKHPLQMPEWKGSKMLKTRRGREAALAVFEAVCGLFQQYLESREIDRRNRRERRRHEGPNGLTLKLLHDVAPLPGRVVGVWHGILSLDFP
jgi:hypothetical protein